MQRLILILLLALATLMLTSTNASAISYMYVPEKARLMTAELVVVGKMNNVNQVDRKLTGTLTITKVLKGDASMKTAKLGWNDLSRFGGGRGHRNGQAGVWILKKGRDGLYATGYPGNFVPMDQLKRVTQSLKEINNLKWTESNGLAMTYITEIRELNGSRIRLQQDQAKPVASLVIYPLMRNTSKETIRVCQSNQLRLFTLTMVAPSGKKKEINLYPRINPNMKLHQGMFRAVEPGAELMAGALNVPNLTECGSHVMALSFENKNDGKAFKLDNVWVGRIDLPSRTVTTPGHPKKAIN